jgi:hypothetical protein
MNNSHRHRHVVLSSPLLLPFAATMTALAIVDCGALLAFAPPTSTMKHRRLPSPPKRTLAAAGGGDGRRSAAKIMASSSGGGDGGDYFPSTPIPTMMIRPPPSPASQKNAKDYDDDASHRFPPQVRDVQLQTLSRILLPSLLSALVASAIFPSLSLGLSYLINDSATFAVLAVDSSQFVQNFLTVTGLTFSILVGQTYYFMYQQQEAVFISLFREVTEAKSLLEQVALVCRGRRDMYGMCLAAMKRYVCVCERHGTKNIQLDVTGATRERDRMKECGRDIVDVVARSPECFPVAV